VIACSLLALCAAPRPARAQPTGATKAMAEALFQEGRRLLAEGKTAEACRKFEGSYRIDPTPGTQLNLASCHEKEGKTATAWGEYSEALILAQKASRADRLKIAKERIAALEPRLSRFMVAVPRSALVEGLAVTVDGAPMDRGAWGTPLPIDPGEHSAVATAPAHERWEQKVTVKEGESRTITVPPLVPVAAPPPPKTTSWTLPVGLGALGLGVVALGAGTYFGARAVSLGSEARVGCPDHLCSPQGFAAFNDGRSAATAADVLLGVGAGFAAGGALLWILGRPADPPPSSAPRPSALRLDLAPTGLTLGGAW
jgi:hypothetical protein